MSNQLFGNVDGFPEGSHFASRIEIKNAGLHRYHINGISRVVHVGCDAIILNGGYIDDEDHGDWILYTGEGGRKEGSRKQEYHQPFNKGNLDLSRNLRSGYPIRVFRGSNHFNKEYAPSSGYRYDGLYHLSDWYPATGKDGFRIYRFVLVKQDEMVIGDLNKGSKKPSRKKRTTYDIQRNPAIPQRLKELYNYNCQVCGIRLEANSIPYAEGAHIKGLGRPHNGSDEIANMIILCPNDHYLFDQFAFSIKDDFTFLGIKGSLTVHPSHHIDIENLTYHREKYLINVK